MTRPFAHRALRLLLPTNALLVLSVCPVLGDDWPQWLGPRRDSVWRETGIVARFPAAGLPVQWRTAVAGGYAGPAVSGNRVFLMDYVRQEEALINDPGARTRLNGQERLLCLDATDGRVLWTYAYDRPYHLSYAAGPRVTPTVDEGRVYALGAEGDLSCVDAASGHLVWSRQLAREYQVETPMWGFCGHPLVNGDQLICLVGGQGSVAVALDKHTGRELWRALSAPEPGYCPPTMIEAAGGRQLLIWHTQSLNALDPETGSLLWSESFAPQYGLSLAAPRQSGRLLYVSGIGNVGAVFQLNEQRPGVEILWRGTTETGIYCAISTPFIDGGVIYGSDCQVGNLRAVRLETGERLWETFEATTRGTRRASHGNAFLVQHEDRFFLLSETGDLILARLTPERYEELDRFRLLEATSEALGRPVVWSHPAFARRCIFARNDREIVCVSLAQ
jgi:outer membrane protein assembly factor BamB